MEIQRITLESLQLPEAAATLSLPTGNNSDIWAGSFTFERGHRYMVSAASGTGKSSLCDFLFGNRIDYRGHILFDGTDARTFGIERWCTLRREALAYMPQEPVLFRGLSVADNIEVKNRLTRRRSAAWINQALEALDVADKAAWPVERLSVGQRQRVAAVRALCQPFSFLLLDEPVSHLDAGRARSLAALVDATAAEEGASVIFTSVGAELPLAAIRLTL